MQAGLDTRRRTGLYARHDDRRHDRIPACRARLWTPDGFREDEWTHAESAEALSGNGRFILPLQAFLDLDPQQRRSARERLGVLLQPGDQLESLADLLDQLSLVALAFPAFSDGRSFSKAELLRSRYRFEGPICAPPGRCWSTSCRICCGSASTSSRSRIRF